MTRTEYEQGTHDQRRAVEDKHEETIDGVIIYWDSFLASAGQWWNDFGWKRLDWTVTDTLYPLPSPRALRRMAQICEAIARFEEEPDFDYPQPCEANDETK